MSRLDPRWSALRVLPSDYTDYGGTVVRWADNQLAYPDCSAGCRHWMPLYDYKRDGADGDWGVCVNTRGPRHGLLTWEHQAGFSCFEKGERYA